MILVIDINFDQWVTHEPDTNANEDLEAAIFSYVLWGFVDAVDYTAVGSHMLLGFFTQLISALVHQDTLKVWHHFLCKFKRSYIFGDHRTKWAGNTPN